MKGASGRQRGCWAVGLLQGAAAWISTWSCHGRVFTRITIFGLLGGHDYQTGTTIAIVVSRGKSEMLLSEETWKFEAVLARLSASGPLKSFQASDW